MGRPVLTRQRSIIVAVALLALGFSPWLVATHFGRGPVRAKAVALFQQLKPGMTIPQFQKLIANCDGVHALAHNSSFFVDGEPAHMRRVIWQFYEHFHFLADFDSNGQLNHTSMVEYGVAGYPQWLRRLTRFCGFSLPGEERHWP
jgi:hypothetical protein